MTSASRKLLIKDEFFKKSGNIYIFFTTVSDTSPCLIRQQKITIMKENISTKIEIITVLTKCFFADINQTNKNALRASYYGLRMFVHKKLPFKGKQMLCPHRKKLFEGISFASSIANLAPNVEKQSLAKAKDFGSISIALDESTDVSGTANVLCSSEMCDVHQCFYQKHVYKFLHFIF